jgi:hypothetical protein
MSVKIAIACENPRYDQYIIRPVLEAVLRFLGKPRARVTVITDPAATSYENLLAQACDILKRYAPVADAVIFIADTDCEDGSAGRRNKALRLRNAVAACDDPSKAITLTALQEVEVWALWGVRDGIDASWAAIRAECNPKEVYFEPLLTQDDQQQPDGGRARLMAQSLSSGWTSLRTGCQELQELEDGLRALLPGSSGV